jgi:hypothetical protein
MIEKQLHNELTLMEQRLCDELAMMEKQCQDAREIIDKQNDRFKLVSGLPISCIDRITNPKTADYVMLKMSGINTPKAAGKKIRCFEVGASRGGAGVLR